MTKTEMLPSLDTMFGRATGAHDQEIPQKGKPTDEHEQIAQTTGK